MPTTNVWRSLIATLPVRFDDNEPALHAGSDAAAAAA